MTSFSKGGGTTHYPIVDVPSCSWPTFTRWVLQLVRSGREDEAIILGARGSGMRVVMVKADGQVVMHLVRTGEGIKQSNVPVTTRSLSALAWKGIRATDPAGLLIQLTTNHPRPAVSDLLKNGPASAGPELQVRQGALLQDHIKLEQLEALTMLRDNLPAE